MSYKELFIRTIEINKDKTKISDYPLFEILFRRTSFFITPFFLKLGFSPNLISGLGFMLGLISSAMIFSSTVTNVRLDMLVFFLAIVVDYSDGNVARVNNRTSFYGQFIDGVIDIVILSAVRLALCRLIMVKIENDVLFWIGIISCILTPLHHLIYDRYSALARWSNEEHGTEIKPYIRKGVTPRITFLLFDFQFTLFFLIPLFINIPLLKHLLTIYFLINIIEALYAVFCHVIYAYKNMN